jgi:hypothetical protein
LIDLLLKACRTFKQLPLLLSDGLEFSTLLLGLFL